MEQTSVAPDSATLFPRTKSICWEPGTAATCCGGNRPRTEVQSGLEPAQCAGSHAYLIAHSEQREALAVGAADCKGRRGDDVVECSVC